MEIGTFGFYVLLPDTEEDAQDERVHLITLLPVRFALLDSPVISAVMTTKSSSTSWRMVFTL